MKVLDLADKAVGLALGVSNLASGAWTLEAAKALIGVLRDGGELHAALTTEERKLAQRIASAVEKAATDALANPEIAADDAHDRRAHFEQVIGHVMPEASALDTALIDAQLDAKAAGTAVAAALREEVTETAPKALAAFFADAHSHDSQFFTAVMSAALEGLYATEGYFERLRRAVFGRILSKLETIDGKLTRLANANPSERDDLIRAAERAQQELGATVSVVQAFLQTILHKKVPPEQFAATLFELAANWRHAGDRLAAMKTAEPLFPEVETLRQQAEAAYAAERFEKAADLLAEIDRLETAALARLQERAAEKRAALKTTRESRIAIALSLGRAEEAATLIVENLHLTLPATEVFDALTTKQHAEISTGRETGVTLHLEVAVALGRSGVRLAEGDDQRFVAEGNLANALEALAIAEHDSAPLMEAAELQRAMLTDEMRQRSPAAWATACHNLGITYKGLAERNPNPQWLQAALNAFEAALTERTPERNADDWASSLVGLSIVQQMIGERTGQIERFKLALRLIDQALTVQTAAKDGDRWVRTMNERGSAFSNAARFQPTPPVLRESIGAYDAALKVCSRERNPMLWAEITGNRAAAVAMLGTLESDAGAMHAAVGDMQAVLTIFTKEAAPAKWSNTTHNMSSAMQTLAYLSRDPAPLRDAIDAYGAALAHLPPLRRDDLGNDTRAMRARAKLGLAEMTADARLAGEALTEARAAHAQYEKVGNRDQAAKLDPVLEAAEKLHAAH